MISQHHDFRGFNLVVPSTNPDLSPWSYKQTISQSIQRIAISQRILGSFDEGYSSGNDGKAESWCFSAMISYHTYPGLNPQLYKQTISQFLKGLPCPNVFLAAQMKGTAVAMMARQNHGARGISSPRLLVLHWRVTRYNAVGLSMPPLWPARARLCTPNQNG